MSASALKQATEGEREGDHDDGNADDQHREREPGHDYLKGVTVRRRDVIPCYELDDEGGASSSAQVRRVAIFEIALTLTPTAAAIISCSSPQASRWRIARCPGFFGHPCGSQRCREV